MAGHTRTETVYYYDELPDERAKAKAREWIGQIEAEDFDAADYF